MPRELVVILCSSQALKVVRVLLNYAWAHLNDTNTKQAPSILPDPTNDLT